MLFNAAVLFWNDVPAKRPAGDAGHRGRGTRRVPLDRSAAGVACLTASVRLIRHGQQERCRDTHLNPHRHGLDAETRQAVVELLNARLADVPSISSCRPSRPTGTSRARTSSGCTSSSTRWRRSAATYKDEIAERAVHARRRGRRHLAGGGRADDVGRRIRSRRRTGRTTSTACRRHWPNSGRRCVRPSRMPTNSRTPSLPTCSPRSPTGRQVHVVRRVTPGLRSPPHTHEGRARCPSPTLTDTTDRPASGPYFTDVNARFSPVRWLTTSNEPSVFTWTLTMWPGVGRSRRGWRPDPAMVLSSGPGRDIAVQLVQRLQ